MAEITVRHSQNESDVVDEVFDSKEDKKGGYLPFLPAVGRNFGDFGFVVQEEKLVICQKINQSSDIQSATSWAAGDDCSPSRKARLK